jgi:DNA repair ATPase RecN
VHDKEEIDFCGCLTCGKGALGDGNYSSSARWVELHSKNKACKVHHRKKLADLRESIRVATLEAVPTEAPAPVAEAETEAPAAILHTVWESLKDNFDPKEAIEYTIRWAVADRINISQHKTEMSELECEHETVVCNMQYDIKQLKQQVSGLQNHIIDQAKRMSELEQRLARLERENKRYKTVYPELPAEDPQ